MTTFQLKGILGEHGIVVITRSGTSPEKFIFQSDLLTKFKTKIDVVTNWVPNEVSSTLARRYLRRGLSVKYMLDDNVVEYIRHQKLYGSDSLWVKKSICMGGYGEAAHWYFIKTSNSIFLLNFLLNWTAHQFIFHDFVCKFYWRKKMPRFSLSPAIGLK